MKRKLFLTAFPLMVVSMCTSAFATSMAQNDALVTPPAKITLSKAIAIAEQFTLGTASRAELEHEHDQWLYDVEVVNGPKVTDVKIDPESGKVLTALLDKPDSDDHRDRDEDEEHEHKD
ncbi:MAG: PepSY domain-containing protein [Desulfobulbus sp.]|nr:PepSY domain-containing protein [Desulfobulbus sp.]